MNDNHVVSLTAAFGDTLIKKGVSIPSVARLMRHKDEGSLLLKKYTQAFEEEMRGIRIEGLGGRS